MSLSGEADAVRKGIFDHKVLNYPFTNSRRTSRKGALTKES